MSGFELISAITFNDIETVKSLLSSHPSLTNFQSYDSRTPLHHACMLDRPHIAKRLLSVTAEPLSKTDKRGLTPLDLAILHGNLATLRLLTELGHADLSFAPAYSHGRDLLFSTAYGSEGDVRRGVGLFDAWVNWRNPDGRCALHWAVLRGHSGIIRALLAVGADAERADRWGVTPLMEATRVGGPVLDAFNQGLQLLPAPLYH